MDVLNILKQQKDAKLKGNLYYKIQTSFAYNTNRIEGSVLSEQQTVHIFETNTLLVEDSVVNIDDIIETTNHFKLFDYMLDTIDEDLTETLIKKYHAILKTGTKDDRERDWFNVGEYKLLENIVANTETSKPENVKKDMHELLKEYNSISNIKIENILDFHFNFERIHPFQDGNGRVGRIIMFRETLKNNIIPFIIDEKYRAYYYRGLLKYKEDSTWLLDTVKSSQDEFVNLCNMFLKTKGEDQ